jgi:hypothetical protein
LRQDVLLFITRIEAILIGFLLLHALQYSTRTVKGQTVSPPYLPKQGTRLLSPWLKPGVLLRGLINVRW